MSENPDQRDIVTSYSDHAADYQRQENLTSCWAGPTRWAINNLRVRPDNQVVVDVGCGTGDAILELVKSSGQNQEFIGIEPAEQMRLRAKQHLQSHRNAKVIDGRFEDLPFKSGSVDYLFSILAFHWTTDVDRSIGEIKRVLKPQGECDLFFTGRHTGRQFTRKTTPVFLKYLGPGLLRSARLRQHLTLESTRKSFGRHFDDDRLTVTESSKVYYDDLDGHWSWWVARAAGHFHAVDVQRRHQCNQEIRQAMSQLEEEQGIPYTVHLIHVSLTQPD